MGFYEEKPPRHGHRTPAELAEDELLSALHGDFCGMPEAPDKRRPTGNAGCGPDAHVALLSWADAHPFITLVRQSEGAAGNAPARAERHLPAPKPGGEREP